MSRDRTNILFIFETNCNWFCVVWSKKTEGQRLVKRNLASPATLMECLPSVRMFALTTSCSRLSPYRGVRLALLFFYPHGDTAPRGRLTRQSQYYRGN